MKGIIMNKNQIFAVTLLLITSIASAQQVFIPVFTSGEQGYNTFRIPAIVKAPNGDLLAFCEGRVTGGGDFGNIDIVLKRSTDQGLHWGDLQVVADAGSLQAGNPAPVVDYTDPDYPAGRIFLFYNTGDNHEGEVRKGNGTREVWYISSTDNGRHWSNPVNISTQVKLPEWRSYANTPGHALQLSSGPHKGRIFVAANHSDGPPQQEFTDYKAHGYFTDDHGKTFRLGASVNFRGSNESTAAELADGRLMMNSRNQRGDIKARIISISSNGGISWDTTYIDHQLPDPVNEGSLLSGKDRKGKALLLFSNAADSVHRNNLCLRISKDGGKHWNKTIVVYKGDVTRQPMDYAAYSDLVQLDGKTAGILFEKDDYRQIVFVRQAF